jgi:hypothetical protein
MNPLHAQSAHHRTDRAVTHREDLCPHTFLGESV